MKIIDAYWEKDNLGVKSCKEIVLEKDDIHDEAAEKLTSINAEYLVAKVPSPRVDLLFLLQENGFKFIETNFAFSLKLNEFAMPLHRKEYLSKFNYIEVNDFDYLYQKIDEGIFRTDKISLDPFFSVKDSACRYIKWMQRDADKINSYFVCSDNEKIGFFSIRDEGEGIYNLFLTGLFRDPHQRYTGSPVIYFPIKESIRRNGVYIKTGTSSNNIRAARLYGDFGYKLSDLTYILIKHSS